MKGHFSSEGMYFYCSLITLTSAGDTARDGRSQSKEVREPTRDADYRYPSESRYQSSEPAYESSNSRIEARDYGHGSSHSDQRYPDDPDRDLRSPRGRDSRHSESDKRELIKKSYYDDLDRSYDDMGRYGGKKRSRSRSPRRSSGSYDRRSRDRSSKSRHRDDRGSSRSHRHSKRSSRSRGHSKRHMSRSRSRSRSSSASSSSSYSYKKHRRSRSRSYSPEVSHSKHKRSYRKRTYSKSRSKSPPDYSHNEQSYSEEPPSKKRGGLVSYALDRSDDSDSDDDSRRDENAVFIKMLQRNQRDAVGSLQMESVDYGHGSAPAHVDTGYKQLKRPDDDRVWEILLLLFAISRI